MNSDETTGNNTEVTEQFEVEGKWAIESIEIANLEKALAEQGFVEENPSKQHDFYLAVDKDSDNLRVRYEECGGVTVIYWTAKKEVVVDGIKTRQENERVLTEEEARLILLGEVDVPNFEKERRQFRRDSDKLLVCIDSIDKRLFFLEVEVLVQNSAAIEDASRRIDELAVALLGVERPREKRSHRKMLFERLAVAAQPVKEQS